MKTDFTAEDRKKIEEGIRGKYAKVAVNPQGLFRYPTGRTGLETLKYNPDILRSLPDAALDCFCGVGNPFSLGEIREGESVLDIGCGGGVDSMVAAAMTGPTGRVVGIDHQFRDGGEGEAKSGPDQSQKCLLPAVLWRGFAVPGRGLRCCYLQRGFQPYTRQIKGSERGISSYEAWWKAHDR